MGPMSRHRGFGFVEFMELDDAQETRRAERHPPKSWGLTQKQRSKPSGETVGHGLCQKDFLIHLNPTDCLAILS